MADELDSSMNPDAATARNIADPSLQADRAGNRKRGRDVAGLDDDVELAAAEQARRQQLEAELMAVFDELVPDHEALQEVRGASPSPDIWDVAARFGETVPDYEMPHEGSGASSFEIWKDAASSASDEENRDPLGTAGLEAYGLPADRVRRPLQDISEDTGAVNLDTPDRLPPTPQSLPSTPGFEIFSDPVSGDERSTATPLSSGVGSAKTDPTLVSGSSGFIYDADVSRLDGNAALTTEDRESPEVVQPVDPMLKAVRAGILAPLVEEWEQRRLEHLAPIDADEEEFSREYPGVEVKAVFDQRRTEAEQALWSEMKMDARAEALLATEMPRIEAHFKRQAEELRDEVDTNNAILEVARRQGRDVSSLIGTDRMEIAKELSEIEENKKSVDNQNSLYRYGVPIEPGYSGPSDGFEGRVAVDADELRDLLRRYQGTDTYRQAALEASLEKERLAGQKALGRAIARKPQDRDALIAGEEARMRQVEREDRDAYSSREHPIQFMEATLREERAAWNKGLKRDVTELRKDHRAANPDIRETDRRKEFDTLRKEFEARHVAAMDADAYEALDTVGARTMRKYGVDEDTIREVLRPVRSAAEALTTNGGMVSNSHSSVSRENEREHERDRQHSSVSR